MRLLTSLALFLLGAIAVPGALLPSDARAQQATAAITDFVGPWIGRTEPGSDRERAATVLIEPGPDKNFRVTWTSFEADPAGSGNVTKRERALTFKPAKEGPLWLSEFGDDPFDAPFAWAFIEGRTLVVSTAGLRPDGKLERQSYRRTLTADGLSLSYKRWLDQDLDREIEAEFLRLLPVPAKSGK
jgi:hypothetical protein